MDPLDITDKARLFALLAQYRRGQAREIDGEEMKDALKQRVQGQDHVVDDLCAVVRRQWGKESRSRPIANFLFIGRPGTGKTELAAAMAEYLFGDDKNMLPFSGTELGGEEGKTRLIGPPTGYVGASEGGHMTRPMFTNPRRLIFFDEVEKAYSGVVNLLLSVMGEGRLTEQGSGKAADFTQAIVVLGSNAHFEEVHRLSTQIRDHDELDRSIRVLLREARAFLPEFLDRLDRIYVFNPLDDATKARVTALKVVKAGQEFGVTIQMIDPDLLFDIVPLGDFEAAGREIVRRVDARLGETLLAARKQGWKRIVIERCADGSPTARQADDDA